MSEYVLENSSSESEKYDSKRHFRKGKWFEFDKIKPLSNNKMQKELDCKTKIDLGLVKTYIRQH